MLDYVTAVNRLIRYALRSITGEVEGFFRPANQRAAAGALTDPYATVLIYGMDFVSYDFRRFAGSDPAVAAFIPPGTNPLPDVVEIIDPLHSFVASVQFWRDGKADAQGRPSSGLGAYSRAVRLTTLIEASPSYELLKSLGLGYAGCGKVRDLTGTVNGNYENRAQVDLTFYASNPEAVFLNSFKIAQFAVKVQSPDGHIDEVNQ